MVATRIACAHTTYVAIVHCGLRSSTKKDEIFCPIFQYVLTPAKAEGAVRSSFIGSENFAPSHYALHFEKLV